MYLPPNRVAGSVYESLTIAGLLDHGAGGAVRLMTTNRRTVIDPPLHQIDRGVACPSDDFENPRVFGRDRLAHETRPGDIGIASVGSRFLGPQVDQYEVTVSNATSVFGGRPEMRIGTVLVYRDDWWLGSGQSGGGDSGHHELLELVLSRTASGAHPLRDFREALIDDVAECRAGAAMARELRRRQPRLEALYQVGG